MLLNSASAPAVQVTTIHSRKKITVTAKKLSSAPRTGIACGRLWQNYTVHRAAWHLIWSQPTPCNGSKHLQSVFFFQLFVSKHSLIKLVLWRLVSRRCLIKEWINTIFFHPGFRRSRCSRAFFVDQGSMFCLCCLWRYLRRWAFCVLTQKLAIIASDHTLSEPYIFLRIVFSNWSRHGLDVFHQQTTSACC